MPTSIKSTVNIVSDSLNAAITVNLELLEENKNFVAPVIEICKRLTADASIATSTIYISTDDSRESVDAAHILVACIYKRLARDMRKEVDAWASAA